LDRVKYGSIFFELEGSVAQTFDCCKLSHSPWYKDFGRSRALAISFANDEGTAALADSLGAVTLLDKMKLASRLIPAIKHYANADHKWMDFRRSDVLET
jgi:hypothetical protein